MRKALTACLLALTVCFAGSCGTSRAPVLVRPGIEVPERPAMLPVTWRHNGTRHCLEDSEARALAINVERLWSHIGILEGCLRAGNGEGAEQ